MIKEGRPNELIKDLWTEIPKAGDAPLRYKIKGQNASAFLPPAGKRSFFRYNGSLTTPPCTENVLWTVMTEPIEFSKNQIDTFKKLYPRNNRPVQKTHQRFVLHYQDRTHPTVPPSLSTHPTSPLRPSISLTPAPTVVAARCRSLNRLNPMWRNIRWPHRRFWKFPVPPNAHN